MHTPEPRWIRWIPKPDRLKPDRDRVPGAIAPGRGRSARLAQKSIAYLRVNSDLFGELFRAYARKTLTLNPKPVCTAHHVEGFGFGGLGLRV